MKNVLIKIVGFIKAVAAKIKGLFVKSPAPKVKHHKK